MVEITKVLTKYPTE